MAITEVKHDLHQTNLAWVFRGYSTASNTGAPSAGSLQGRLWRIGTAMAAASMKMARKVTPLHQHFIVDERFVTVAANGTVAWDASLTI